MNWRGVVQKKGTLSRLETHGNDIRPLVEYTHTFVFINEDGRADERQDLFYTALGSTPQEAADAAEMVYLRATACQHKMVQKSSMLLECRSCGIQQRINPKKGSGQAASTQAKQPTDPGIKPKSKGFFGLFKK